MLERRYSKILVIIIVLVIIGIIGLLAFLGYDTYKKYAITKEGSDFVDNFQGEFSDEEGDENKTINQNTNLSDGLESVSTNTKSGTKTYKGFVVMGTMEIPAIDFKNPVLEKVTTSSLEASVAILCGAGLNQPGNTVIYGHNYRNGTFFSNNKKLSVDDKIYITDNSGTKKTYKIYNKFETDPDDTSFYQRDTDGKAEVTLSTCTDDVTKRLIIEAVVED